MKCRIRIAASLLCAVILTGHSRAESAIPWEMQALTAPPKSRAADGFDEGGVKSLFFEGLPYHGAPTEVFAWYGAPRTETGKKVPGMVLVHGGGGTAFAEWVRLWTGRGYAAIAMDTCGCVPRGEYGKWERHELGGPPGWGGFEHIDEPVEDQWTYHAVADVILAHSLLRAMPEIDPERTGITGISWGGYLTCIAAGVDERFKFAVPVYGCGYLGDDSAWLDVFERMGTEKAQRWLALWDPSVYLPNARMPMLWVTGTNDFAYPMDSLRKSYALPHGPRTLCVRLRMPHGHGGAGENPEEIHAFANNILREGAPLLRVARQGRDEKRVWAQYEGKRVLDKAELNYTCDAGVWKEREWTSAPAAIEVESRTVSATLPDGVTVYYFNVYDDSGLVVSSEHEECEPSQ